MARRARGDAGGGLGAARHCSLPRRHKRLLLEPSTRLALTTRGRRPAPPPLECERGWGSIGGCCIPNLSARHRDARQHDALQTVPHRTMAPWRYILCAPRTRDRRL